MDFYFEQLCRKENKMAGKRYAKVEERRCVACGACVKECPRGAISVCNGCYARVNTDTCVGCGLCARICPAGVIEVCVRDAEAKEV